MLKPRCTNTKAEALMLVGDLFDRLGDPRAADWWWDRSVALRVRHARRRRALRGR